MKFNLCIPVIAGLLLMQCKDKNEIVPPATETRQINILDFSVPGIDPSNIRTGKDFILINLPKDYKGGNFMKPSVIFQAGYSSDSDLLNGFNFEGKELVLHVAEPNLGSRSYTVCVVPYRPVTLSENIRNYDITLGPDAALSIPLTINGTLSTIDQQGRVVRSPKVVLTSRLTGEVRQSLFTDLSGQGPKAGISFRFPPDTEPGEYSAEIVWGEKKEPVSNNISIKKGLVQLKRPSFKMLKGTHYFEVNGFNISDKNKYEAVVKNDFTSETIQLTYKDAGTLWGNLSENTGTGNYKVTYLENGKILKPLEEKTDIVKYMGEDNLYIRNVDTQPILRIISQPSKSSEFETILGTKLPYFVPATVINRSEPLIAYIDRPGASTSQNDLVLINTATKKEFIIPRSDQAYSMFDGLMMFPVFDIRNIPAGKYESYVVTGTEKSERYGQLITIL
ncbi:hypothetical protein [Dyadobacter sandarakinus]|uniref:DUF4397 domain-containing protein n=1 Tax=Dyadobacter sandarakinus TaxID=2747268 RepID=A0ABX7I5V5_9BACT|nr:hypothetical protein [Dyadobacter sandarakinus]QRR01165.1 hypothetical protein HWI92_09745 [Dyadobacter sandarakinus]